MLTETRILQQQMLCYLQIKQGKQNEHKNIFLNQQVMAKVKEKRTLELACTYKNC